MAPSVPGAIPMSIFVFHSRWLWGGGGGGVEPRPSDYQADVLPPDHAAPRIYCLLRIKMRIIWFPCSLRPRDMGQQALSHLFDMS